MTVLELGDASLCSLNGVKGSSPTFSATCATNGRTLRSGLASVFCTGRLRPDFARRQLLSSRRSCRCERRKSDQLFLVSTARGRANAPIPRLCRRGWPAETRTHPGELSEEVTPGLSR